MSGIELLLRANVTADEETELREFFGRFGEVSRVRRTVGYRGPAEWIVLVALPLQAFLQNLGVLGSSDAYAGIKGLVEHLRGEAARAPAATGLPAERAGAARGSDSVPPLVLQDPRSGVSVLLESDLPVPAYRQLVELDLAQFATGPIVYDRVQGRWNGLKG